MPQPAPPSPRLPALVVLGVTAFVLTAVVRYSAPEGSLGGLTDDHFFYVTQGWQMLFGELPDRDYFEPGAPLTLGISAVLQVLLGRSVWSEYVFCVVALAGGTALASVLAARATGSILLGVAAYLFQFALLARLYNYPKILVYAVAIAAIWAWSSSPRFSRAAVVAAVTAVAFLLRHDHGVYVGLGFTLALVLTPGLGVVDRVRHAVVYGVVALAFLVPYLTHLQMHGGIGRHFADAYGWAARDYLRSPLVFPRFEWHPLFGETLSEAPLSEWWEHPPIAPLAEHATFWLYWLSWAVPFAAVAFLVVRPRNAPRWTEEASRMAPVIVMGLAVNYGFLRGNLAGRLADVSVPIAILAVWVLARAIGIAWRGSAEVWGRVWKVGAGLRTLLAGSAAAATAATALVLVQPLARAVFETKVTEGPAEVRERLGAVTRRLKNTWPLDPRDERSDILLARYLQACTASTDRVLVTEFRPQVVGLSQRGFAAGHVDLRSGGFFGTRREQELLIERWRRQSVPIVIGPTADDWPAWSEGLPLAAAHLVGDYRNLGEQNVDGFRFLLFVHRDAAMVRTYPPLALPCLR